MGPRPSPPSAWHVRPGDRGRDVTEQTAAGYVRRVLHLHRCGVYTDADVFGRLVAAAADFPPGDLAPGLPPDWLAEIREAAAEPPGRPGQVGDPEAEARRFFDGLLAW